MSKPEEKKKPGRPKKMKATTGSISVQNVTDFPTFSEVDLSSSVTYSKEVQSTPLIDSPLKFVKEGDYFTLDENVSFGGHTQTHEFKVVNKPECKCGGVCKKNKQQQEPTHEEKATPRKSWLNRIFSLFKK